MQSIRRDGVRRHGDARKGGRGVASPDAAVVDALDHLLDPLDELEQEEFDAELLQGTRLAPVPAPKLAHRTTSGRSAALEARGRATFLVANARGSWRALRQNLVPYVVAVVVAVIVGWVLAQA